MDHEGELSVGRRAWLRLAIWGAAGLSLRDLSGMDYNPLSRQYSLGSSLDVNYLAYATRSQD